MMSPMCPVRAWPSAESRAPGPPEHHAFGEKAFPGGVLLRSRGVGDGEERRPRRPRRIDEVLVFEAEHGTPAHGQVAAAGQALGVEPGGPVERLGHRRPPVHHQRLVVGTGDGQTSDVERLPQAGSVPAVGVRFGEPVDAPEVEGLITDVELFEAGQARAHHDVALGAGLEGPALSEIQHPLEHLACLAAHGLQTIVGAIEELLLSLQIGMVWHVAPFSPARQGNGSAYATGNDPGTQHLPPTMSRMLISTMNDAPGYRVTSVLGEVFGLTVRSRNVGSQIGASFKSLAGGELKGMTKNLQTSREEVVARMVSEAEARGGNAVLAMRFDTSEMGGNWTEICAYGTAVVIEPLG